MKIYKSLMVIGATALVGLLAACGDDPSSSAQSANPVSRSATAAPAIAVPLSVIQQAGSPSISGNPAPSVQAGDAYDFLPTASDPSGNTLTFSIQNKPAWASFNIMTGELTGTPAESDVGLYSDIVISASDSAASTALTGFSVQVVSTTGASSTTTVSSSSTPVSTAASTSVATPVVAAVSAPTSAPSSSTTSSGITAPSTSAVSTAVVMPLTAVQPTSSGSSSTNTVSSGSSSTSNGTSSGSSGTSSNSNSSSTGSNAAAGSSSGGSSSGGSSSSGSSSGGSSSSGSSSSGSSSSGGSGGSIQYPRLAWDVASANDRAGVVSYAQHMDVQIYGDAYEGAAYSSTTRAALVSSMIAGDGVVTPKVIQYVVGNVFYADNSGSPSPEGTPIWAAQLNAMASKWFLYTPSGAHSITPDNPPNSWMTNPNPAFTDSNGNSLEAALAKYADNLHRTGGSSQAAPALSGWFHDNFGTPPGCTQGDYLHNGSNLSGCDPANATTYLAGQKAWINWYRANAPGQFLMGNLTLDYMVHIGDTYAASPIYGALDAAMTEDALGPQYSIEHWSGFEAMRTQIQLVAASVIHPEYNVAVQYGINYSNGEDADFNTSIGQAMRYGMCAILTISNSTYTFFDQYTPGVWFDYFAVNPTTGVALDYASSTTTQLGAARYWLGTPIDAVQTAPTQGKVYARRFRMPNGRTALVLVNPSANGGNSGAAPQTINLSAAFGGTWTHVRASGGSNAGSNAQVDSGATVSSVTVPVGDGMILIQ